MRVALLAICLGLWQGLLAQTAEELTLPAGTGYVLIGDGLNEEQEAAMFAPDNSLRQWGKYTTSPIGYFVQLRRPGTLHLELTYSGSAASITAAAGRESFTTQLPASKKPRRISLGNFTIDSAGYHTISLHFAPGTGGQLHLRQLHLGGTAASGISANTQARRNAASVHLRYAMPDSVRITSFYNEITVPRGADPLHSFYMACGFGRGYLGMQVNSGTERRIIFSVWDAGYEATDRKKVPDSNRVQLLAKGSNVVAEDFGNEGTGGHSHWVYSWQADSTYRFLVVALPDTARHSTLYSGYFFVPETKKWKLLACFRAPADGQYLQKPYAFIENFWGSNGHHRRSARFTNTSVQDAGGSWQVANSAWFTTDETGQKGYRNDFGGGPLPNGFSLWTGGFRKSDARPGEVFLKKVHAFTPSVAVASNTDSATQALADQALLVQAMAAGKLDTTGSIQGMWYKIIQPGTGRQVQVNDTVVAHYKGTLLNGQLFDQTKEKPARFPLNRLIRGWQLGLPLLRTGGQIRLYVPSGLGYSIRTRSTNIPPNSILVFDVTVVDAEPPAAGR